MRRRAFVIACSRGTVHGAKACVARWLLVHCPEERRALVLDVPAAVLASRLSITAETFSRVTKQLVNERVIEVYSAHLTVLDRTVLSFAAVD